MNCLKFEQLQLLQRIIYIVDINVQILKGNGIHQGNGSNQYEQNPKLSDNAKTQQIEGNHLNTPIYIPLYQQFKWFPF